MSNKTEEPGGNLEPGTGVPQPESAAAAKAESAPKAKKPRAKKEKPAGRKDKPAGAKTKAAPKKTRKTTIMIEDGLGEPLEVPVSVEGGGGNPAEDALADPIGDLSDGEARALLGPGNETESAAMMEAYRADTTTDAEQGLPEMAETRAGVGDKTAPEGGGAESQSGAQGSEGDEGHEGDEAVASDEDDEEEFGDEEARKVEPRTPGKLERLQKILSQAGIASRRHAEEMIVAGRVAVNGQVVTTLGAKADPARDHIRVDGKLLHGAERHRYFVLNKPKGYVTTVSDPEGRPTVTEFFAKLNERLYPVGRLDYQSEGLLLMTNDGELANQLTRAASGVEKTYLVKVAGQPTVEELERLRGGVSIERAEPGSPKVRTAPARVQQVRQGDNPWYEVVLIEGRNRELRKMFSAIGHFVEKIRRVGYGPLVLDVEPGQFRELDQEELAELRLAAEGKRKPGRARAGFGSGSGEAKRPKNANTPPRETGRPTKAREAGSFERRGGRDFEGRGFERGGRRESEPFRAGAPGAKPPRPTGGARQKPDFRRGAGAPRTPDARQAPDTRQGTEARPSSGRQGLDRGPGPGSRSRGPFRGSEDRRGGGKPGFGKQGFGRPQSEAYGGRSQFGRTGGERNAGQREQFGARGGGREPFRGRQDSGQKFDRGTDRGPETGSRPRFEGRGSGFRPQQRNEGRQGDERSQSERPANKPFRKPGERPYGQRGGPKQGRSDQSAPRTPAPRTAAPRTAAPRSFGSESRFGQGAERGEPSRGGPSRGGTARNGPNRGGMRSAGANWKRGPAREQGSGARPANEPATPRKNNAGAGRRPATGARPGGFSKARNTGFKGKPGSGAKRGGSRPSGPRAGGRPRGNKRG